MDPTLGTHHKETHSMNLKKILGTATAAIAVTAAAVLYTLHPVKSSDHQDTYNLATRPNTSADITDVYVFPSPNDNTKVVFAMNVSPLIMPGDASKSLDPTLLYQFKIAHGKTNYKEDQVIQVAADRTGIAQTVSLYGPGLPNETGTVNTLLPTASGSTTLGSSVKLQNNTVQFFAGTRTDPFFFDLFAFFTFLGDRNYGTHTSQTDPGPETAANPEGFSNGNDAANAPGYDKTSGGNPGPKNSSFNGFAKGTMAGFVAPALQQLGAPNNYACSTAPASDTLFNGGAAFNVISLVVEVPKSLIEGAPFNTPIIHVWATASSSTGS